MPKKNISKNEMWTELRKIFVIKLLSNSKKISITNLRSGVNKLIEDYSKERKIKPPKPMKQNNAIRPVLDWLYKDKIICKEPIPDNDPMWSGPGVYSYWLKNHSRSFTGAFLLISNLRIFGSGENFDKLDYFLKEGSKFINSPYAKSFLDIKLINILFEEFLKVSINPQIKEYILDTIKISPTALLSMILYFNEIYIDYKNKNMISRAQDVKIIPYLLMKVSNGLTTDILYPSFLSKTNFDLTHEILLKKDNDSYLKITGINTEYKDQKKDLFISWDMRELKDPKGKFPNYGELSNANSCLNDLLNIASAVTDEVILKKPKLKNQLQKAFNKRSNEIKKISSKMEEESIKLKLKKGFLADIIK
jgi:hypothetical protein